MLQSQLFYKAKKENPKDEVSINAQLLERAGFIDKLMAGVYSFLPLGLKTLRKIEEIIRQEMNKIGGQEVFMPTLQPLKNWKKTGRDEKVDVLIKLGFEEKKNLVLGPTHEEVISPLAKKVIFSYKNLPQYVYQFQNKFRKEKRSKSGILRLREFIMKDLYSFHSNQEDLNDYYEKVRKAYERIFKRCGIGEKTYLTYASGGAFSKYSHEFQTETTAGEDIIYFCEKCQVAINKEIIEDQKYVCPQCNSKGLVIKKAIEVGNIFKLGTRFSDPFGLFFKDKDGSEKPVIMGCYGIGLQRLMGTIVEIYHDENGIIWPTEVSPFLVHLVTLDSTEKKVLEFSKKIYDRLSLKNVEVLFDDRLEVSIGEKFSESDLLGIPWRIVVSKKNLENKQIELKARNKKEPYFLSEKDLNSFFSKELKIISN